MYNNGINKEIKYIAEIIYGTLGLSNDAKQNQNIKKEDIDKIIKDIINEKAFEEKKLNNLLKILINNGDILKEISKKINEEKNKGDKEEIIKTIKNEILNKLKYIDYTERINSITEVIYGLMPEYKENDLIFFITLKREEIKKILDRIIKQNDKNEDINLNLLKLEEIVDNKEELRDLGIFLNNNINDEKGLEIKLEKYLLNIISILDAYKHIEIIEKNANKLKIRD
ncbi:MAG: hypothetical protein ACP5RQ_01025 [Candidatus Micrarchaeia archaeon]